MKSVYKITYEVKETEMSSSNYGYVIMKTKKFPSLSQAVEFSRHISNNDVNLIGKPVIEEEF
jgi:hypothetical protein